MTEAQHQARYEQAIARRAELMNRLAVAYRAEFLRQARERLGAEFAALGEQQDLERFVRDAANQSWDDFRRNTLPAMLAELQRGSLVG